MDLRHARQLVTHIRLHRDCYLNRDGSHRHFSVGIWFIFYRIRLTRRGHFICQILINCILNSESITKYSKPQQNFLIFVLLLVLDNSEEIIISRYLGIVRWSCLVFHPFALWSQKKRTYLRLQDWKHNFFYGD